jgi:ethanolamine-phosphate cytidylyltransferase
MIPPTQKFLATSRRIMSFSNHREPKASDRVIYVDGDFDMMHNGHIELLRKAKEKGDFLYVGIYDDNIVYQLKGNNFPILSLNERVLMVLANKFVDDVIIGAPLVVGEDLMKTFNIASVI